jgi:hypothetical protein
LTPKFTEEVKMLRRLQRGLTVLGMFAAATFAVGPCAPTYADITKMVQASGADVIKTVSDRYFDLPVFKNGQWTTKGDSDFDRWVRLPATAALQAGWNNAVDYRVPQDPADALRSGALVRR